MLVCTNCGYVGEEDSEDWAIEREYHTELDGNPCEYITCCPTCGSTDIEEAKICDICGEPFAEERMISIVETVERDGETYEEDKLVCPDCYDDYVFIAPGVYTDKGHTPSEEDLDESDIQ